MLVRLKRLKESAIRSSWKRSPSGMRLERRMSHWKKLGEVKRLRPRLPSQPAGGEMVGKPGIGTGGTAKGFPLLSKHIFATPKVTPGMKGEVVAPPTEGRACEAPRSSRVSA